VFGHHPLTLLTASFPITMLIAIENGRDRFVPIGAGIELDLDVAISAMAAIGPFMLFLSRRRKSTTAPLPAPRRPVPDPA
jgi:hypothetical protein